MVGFNVKVMMRSLRAAVGAAFTAALMVACQQPANQNTSSHAKPVAAPTRTATPLPPNEYPPQATQRPPNPPGVFVNDPQLRLIVQAAVAQVGVTVHYDPNYVRLTYPNGDVPLDRGVCSDVVIRALRAVNFDLQRAVHEDMRTNFARYPQRWGLRRPDPNIDHRRVANLMTYFTRRGLGLKVSANRAAYKAGDFVAWQLPSGQVHIGVVSNQLNEAERLLIVHNIGAGAQLEDVLFAWRIIGHYRL